tara:strand:- start:1318 stop:2520 length:1203 start_codon:yes stop_codon:yes gene_type:complete
MYNVVTLGLGYIGLPTSVLIAANGIDVYGVDINKNILNSIKKGQAHIAEPNLNSKLKEVIKNESFKVGLNPIQGNVYLILVPTPFKKDNTPDISYIEAATLEIIPLLKDDDLFIIESTSPVGTTEKIRDLIYSKRPELNNKINIAYCPERVLPGNIMYELIHNDRVIGGIDDESSERAAHFYSTFVSGKLNTTNSRTAEMCKLTENSSRDVQIAFANELSIICDKAGIDVRELIKLANLHPRVDILNPGCGVGGHCIAVDPYFITSKFPLESKLISTGREINNYKALWCVEKIINTQKEFETNKKLIPSIALLGLTFKPDIDDLRESPALFIAKKIKSKIKNRNLFFVEPNIEVEKELEITDLKTAIQVSDIVVILVAHKEFRDIDLSNKIVIDFCGARQ